MTIRKNRRAPEGSVTLLLALSLLSLSAVFFAASFRASPQKSRLADTSKDALGNYPDTTLPLSSNSIVTPDAPPTNITSITAFTSTNFKGTFAADPMTGVLHITDAHPAGAYLVTVTAFNGGIPAGTKTFGLIVTTPPACATVAFASPTPFATGDDPQSAAIGDFNGDGNQDLALPNLFSDNVSILLGDGAGHFSADANFTAGNEPQALAVGDFNGDGKQDLAVANHGSDNVSVLLGDGAGSFSNAVNYDTGLRPFGVAVGDFNGDGKQDLAVADQGSGVAILLGDAAGNFSAAINFDVGSGPESIAIGDFNNDGKQDVVTANFDSSNVSILLGDGTGNFSPRLDFVVGLNPVSVTVGDFNNDGKQDVATANRSSYDVSIVLGDGMGSFGPPANFVIGSYPSSVAVGDFNSDGNEDLVTIGGNSPLLILLGDGTGSFAPPLNIDIHVGFNLAVGDFNGDGRQDLAVANDFIALDTVGIFLSQPCSSPTPTPTGTPPNLGTYPNTSIPLSSDTTVTPDTVPVAATTIIVSTSTSFQGSLTGDPTTGVVRVTNAHPAGSYEITVRAFNPTGVTTTATFTLTITTEGCIPVNFDPALNLYTGVRPQSVAVGDFNGDGNQDLVVGDAGINQPPKHIPGNLAILLGNGAGNFSTINVSASPFFVAVGDFNGDGKQDVAINDSRILIMLGDGTGHFGTTIFVGAGPFPTFFAAGDFNGDGKQDLVVCNANNTAWIVLGNGAGGFSAYRNFAFGPFGPNGIAVGDFNEDGNLDFAVVTGAGVKIFLGDGTADFAGPTSFPAGSNSISLAVGDFNNDGKQDLAIANFSSNDVSVLLGNGVGGFIGPTNFDAGPAPISVITGDFNGDSKQDLAVAHSGSTNIAILVGDGSGGFGGPRNFEVGPGPTSIAVGDFNGDARQDLATANYVTDTPSVSLLLGNCAVGPSPTPTPLPATHFAVVAPGVVSQKIPFNFTVTALDQFNQLVTGYTGTVHFSSTSSGGPTQLPADSTLTNGTGTFSAILNVGLQTITATDTVDPSITGTSDQIIVLFPPSPTPTVTATATPTATGSPTPTPTVTATSTPTITPTPLPSLFVTNTNDSGPGSLRQVIAEARDGDKIQFDPALNGQTIFLTTGELVIDKNIILNGPGSDLLTVSRSSTAPSFRIFHAIPKHTVTIAGLTISGGSGGGGILVEVTSLTIDHCTVSGNSNDGGGGGGITTRSAILTIVDSTVSNNNTGFTFRGGGSGGGISSSDGTYSTILRSTIAHNGASNRGGGIDGFGYNSFIIVDSTITDNFAPAGGGGIAADSEVGEDITITRSTINGNSGDSGAIFFGGSHIVLEIGNTILSSTSGVNIFNPAGSQIISHGYNISNDDGSGFLTGPGDQINTDPLLGPLQNNGGPTSTHMPLNGSPAVDTGDPSFTPPPLYDQRDFGYVRVYNGRIDVGSLELQPAPAISPTPTAQLANISTRLHVGTGDEVSIGGFIVAGAGQIQVVVRGLGPSLGPQGVPNFLANPYLELRDSIGAVIAHNDNWQDDPVSAGQLTKLGLAPTNDLEAALLATIKSQSGFYTGIIKGSNGETGTGLVEIYNVNQTVPGPKIELANISTRGFVDTGNSVMIGGFIVSEATNTHVVVRGVGPSLSQVVPNALADPTLELRDANGSLLVSNDNWQDNPTSAAQLTANGLGLSNPNESGIYASVFPGAYTAILAGNNGLTGVALVEVYDLR